MPLPKPEPGLVLRYSFLFANQVEKERPVVIVTAVSEGEDESLIVRVVPITHTPPSRGEEQNSFELPTKIKEHLNLDDARSWVRLDEINVFHWAGYDLRPLPSGKFDYGFLPPNFFGKLTARFSQLAQIQKITSRDD